MKFRPWGFSIGPLHVTWRDLWAELESPLRPAPGARGLEIAWHNTRKPGQGRVLLHRGFKAEA